MKSESPLFQRALVAGWFSFEHRKATFGDVEAKNVVCDWLTRRGIPFDVAGHESTRVEGIDLERLDPKGYDLFIFVCGPWTGNKKLLSQFSHCYKVGVNLSVVNPEHHGFDCLLPRDLPTVFNPDIVFGANTDALPLVGILLVHPQPAYGDRQRHHRVRRIVEEFLRTNRVVPIRLDTLLQNNQTCIETVAQLEALVRRADLVISTRLHGMVFSLKNETPVIAIDPVAGGAKVTAQARALGWPLLFNGDTLSKEELEHAVAFCLSGAMQEKVEAVRATAIAKVRAIEMEFEKMLFQSTT